jgi:cytochrome c-type biogenesis protein CcmH
MSTPASPLDWLIFASGALVAAAGAGAWLLRAGARARARPPADPVEAELAIYRDQLDELRRDLDAGRVAPEAMEAARLEIGRRLAKAEARAAVAAAPVKDDSRAAGLATLALAGLVVAGAVGLYAWRGSPGMADAPFDARASELLRREPQSLSADEIIVLLQDRAQAAPKDATPHLLMGQVMAGDGRDADALRAFQAALRRDPRNADALTEIGATLMRMNGGALDADARAAFAAAKAVAPDAPGPDFHLALADWNAGRRGEAMDAWRALWARLPADGLHRVALANNVAQTLARIDVDAGGEQGQAMGEAMAQASPEARMATIRAMVDARAARLAADPGDHALRLSLARVRGATGDVEGALALLLEGARRVEGDPLLRAVYAVARGDAPTLPAPPKAAVAPTRQ